MTPLTARTPLSCGLSKWSSSRSAMLDVNSRVEIARHADVDPAKAPTQAGQVEQVAGPLGPDLGRHLRQHRAEQIGQAGQPGVPLLDGVGVAGGELGDLLVAGHRIVRELQVTAVRVRREVGPLRVDPVAVPLQLELPKDGRRHQAHDVGECRHLVVGPPRGLRHGGPTDGVPALQHHDPLPGLGQQPGRHEAVVAAADHDDVVLVGPTVHAGARGAHGRHGTARLRRTDRVRSLGSPGRSPADR